MDSSTAQNQSKDINHSAPPTEKGKREVKKSFDDIAYVIGVVSLITLLVGLGWCAFNILIQV
jgi:hypothetical protein